MIGFARIIAVIGIALTSFLTRQEFKKMSNAEKSNK